MALPWQGWYRCGLRPFPELARRAGAYDYRTFFKALLGRFWMSYEVLLLLLIMLVLGVINAASQGMLLRLLPDLSPCCLPCSLWR